MCHETTKAEIRKRLFFFTYGAKDAPEHIAKWFRLCPECNGKRIFYEACVDEDGRNCEAQGVCARCDGWGYIYKDGMADDDVE